MEKIHMIGCDAVHPSDFVYDAPPNRGYYLLILTKTPAVFRVGEEEKEYPAHHAALFTPECRIHYRASGEQYRNDWMVFWSDELYVTQFPKAGEPFPVRDPVFSHILIHPRTLAMELRRMIRTKIGQRYRIMKQKTFLRRNGCPSVVTSASISLV